MRKTPWDDITLRKAVSLAIDQKALIRNVLLGYGREQDPGLVAFSDIHANKSLTPLPRDVDGAKALLDATGYVDKTRDGLREDKAGKAMRLEVLTANTPAQMNLAELAVNQIRQIGIDAYFTPPHCGGAAQQADGCRFRRGHHHGVVQRT